MHVDIELREEEAGHAERVQKLFQNISDAVSTRILTDKAQLATHIRSLVTTGALAEANSEVAKRALNPLLSSDCLDVLVGLFLSVERVEANEPVKPYFTMLMSLPQAMLDTTKDRLIEASLSCLSERRRLDACRQSLLPACEVIAGLVKLQLLSARAMVRALMNLMRDGPTRCAGVTCLGKMVEGAFDAILDGCNDQLLEDLRQTLHSIQDDWCAYDIMYISQPFRWGRQWESPQLQLRESRSAHRGSILSLSVGGPKRRLVATSSLDSTVLVWDQMKDATFRVDLPTSFYSCAVEFFGAETLLVGANGRSAGMDPVVHIFGDDGVGEWSELSSIMPEEGRFITCIRGLAGLTHFACGICMSDAGYVACMDAEVGETTCESRGHTDVVTCIATHDDVIYSGSRDSTVVLFDTRSSEQVALPAHERTVTSLSVDDVCLWSGGLDRRVYRHDVRMTQQPVCMYELDSPILAVCGWGQGVVVATSNGLYTTSGGELSLVPVPSPTGDGSVRGSYFNCLQWDREERKLFAAGEQGTVDVFSPPF